MEAMISMGDTWQIREATSAAEADACAAMMARSDPWRWLGRTEQQCAAALRHPHLRVHVAASEAEVLGFIASMEFGVGFEPLIEYVCVDAAQRNSGVGSRLIEYFERELYPTARNLYLFVSDINPHAQRLYLRLGYVPAGALPNYNLEMQTEFLFRKTRGPRQPGRLWPGGGSAR
jgi:ribosomal protein S18 acetylase RimI-like enzyme